MDTTGKNVYGMQIVENYLYILTSRDFVIYSLIENLIIKSWPLPTVAYNITIDENLIYISSNNVISVYNKEGKSRKEKEILRIGAQTFCGIAHDKEYLYICEQEEKTILVFNKETNLYIREIGKKLLTKPSSIYIDQSFLYVWDFKCITVLSTDIEEKEFFHKIFGPSKNSCPGLESLGNLDGTTYLTNHISIVNNRLYIAVPNLQCILMYE